MTDPIADMLTRIRNALMVQEPSVTVPFSKIKFEIGKKLEQEGFIKNLERTHTAGDVRPAIQVTLKYVGKESSIRGMKRISKPGRRVYKNHNDIPKVLPSLGILILSTSQGIMTNREAKEKHIGGEVLCEVY